MIPTEDWNNNCETQTQSSSIKLSLSVWFWTWRTELLISWTPTDSARNEKPKRLFEIAVWHAENYKQIRIWSTRWSCVAFPVQWLLLFLCSLSSNRLIRTLETLNGRRVSTRGDLLWWQRLLCIVKPYCHASSSDQKVVDEDLQQRLVGEGGPSWIFWPRMAA